MRVDIDEGSYTPDQCFSFGRIKSAERLAEWYLSIKLGRHALFAASGIYNGKTRGFRWYVYDIVKARAALQFALTGRVSPE